MKVRLTFTEEILGTANNDKDIHAEYIASKAPDAPSIEEEIRSLINKHIYELELPSVFLLK